jgi:hypothetical protein
MLVPQGGEPSLFSDDPLVLLERLANCTSSNLGVFVIPDFIQSIDASSGFEKGTIREELSPGGSRHCWLMERGVVGGVRQTPTV